ncbi:MAG: hypothetical protein U0792_18325 [Gemmataceae bacterium]
MTRSQRDGKPPDAPARRNTWSGRPEVLRELLAAEGRTWQDG